jgi:two-component system chemotaxis response regulator CheB
MRPLDHRNIIVIGGSAGAGAVVRQVLGALPADLKAAIFIVTHSPNHGAGYLVELLRERCALPVSVAVDGQPIELGHVYLPAADRHLLINAKTIVLGAGPRENMSRPAIDPLFRSAALVFGPRVVGLLLSGFLNDGVSGLGAIQARGGVALVQHPLDAETPQMPEAALESLEPDRVLRADEMALALSDLAREPAPDAPLAPDPALDLEVRIAAGARLGSEKLEQIAEPVALTCPHCHGVLSEVKEAGPLRYRCQTGHAFTAQAALASQQAEADEALMVALRVMEERVSLVSRMADDARARGHGALAELYDRRVREYSGYADTLRKAAIQSLDTASPV